MFYPSYEDYMRDMFYFNGLQNTSAGYPYMGFYHQNLNDYYPSIYKIVYPVIQRVVNGNNYQYTNEESVNNMVDVILGITAGDINAIENSGNMNDSMKKQNQASMSNANGSEKTPENNTLLKDLIKILTIKELQGKQNVRRFPYYMQNQSYMVN